jgi:hypothetical protein
MNLLLKNCFTTFLQLHGDLQMIPPIVPDFGFEGDENLALVRQAAGSR